MEKIIVLEKGQKLEFSFEDLLKYHGVGYPGGVAHAFQVMQRAFPQLDDGKLLERREIELVTAFPGPGGLDAFEMVTRCVTGGRSRHSGKPPWKILFPVQLQRKDGGCHHSPGLCTSGFH